MRDAIGVQMVLPDEDDLPGWLGPYVEEDFAASNWKAQQPHGGGNNSANNYFRYKLAGYQRERRFSKQPRTTDRSQEHATYVNPRPVGARKASCSPTGPQLH